GGFLMTMGFAVFAADILLRRFHGRRAARDPWHAETLEWTVPVPAPSYAFASLPRVASRAPLHDTPGLARGLAAGEGYLAFARNGWPETLGVDVVSGRAAQVVVLPRPTALPFWTAVATGGFFLSLLFKLYWLTPPAALVVLVLLLMWSPV